MNNFTRLIAGASALLLAGCAAPPVKPLYPAESARLRTIEMRVAAPREAISVEQLVANTVVTPVGPGAYSGAGILGAAIGAAIVGAIQDAQAKRAADGMRLELAGLQDQVADVDYARSITRTLEAALRKPPTRIAEVRSMPLPATRGMAYDQPQITPAAMADIARASRHDAVLFVIVTRAFSRSAGPGAAAPGRDGGMSLGFQARVVLLGKDGAELMKDTIVFVAPRSADASNEARVTWWRDHARYRRLLEISGQAFAAALQDHLLATPRFANDAAFQEARAKKVSSQEEAARTGATLQRFHTCDDFHRAGADAIRFEFYRSEAVGALRVGLVCSPAFAALPDASPAAPAAGSTSTVVAVAESPAARLPVPSQRLVGRWTGTMQCGRFQGPGAADYAAGWTAQVVMTVQGDQATMTRGDRNYSETLQGSLRSDGSLPFEGQGERRAPVPTAWSTKGTGQFFEAGNDVRFEGRARVLDPRGVLLRDCTVALGR